MGRAVSERGDGPPERLGSVPAAWIVGAVVAVIALRAMLGASFYDDTYYVSIAMRFARGELPFVDEMSGQALGQMAMAPFVKAWMALFGTSGILLSTRLLYVVLVVAVAYSLHVLLRGAVRPVLLAVAFGCLAFATPYNLIAMTYNTIAELLLVLATVLCFAAIRDDDRGRAVAAGVAAGVASLAHPPLFLAALALLVTFAAVARRTRLALPAWASAGAMVALAVVAVLSFASVADIRATLDFAQQNVVGIQTPAHKAGFVLGSLLGALASPALWPMWAFAVLGALPGIPRRVRAAVLALLPLTAAIPGAIGIASGDGVRFGVSVMSWLLALTAGAAVPALVWMRAHRGDLSRLLVLATPVSLVGFGVILVITTSRWSRGMTIVGLAPLVLVVLLGWLSMLADNGGRSGLAVGSAVALVVAGALLFATVFNDTPPWKPHALVRSGAYAGLWAGEERVRQIAELTTASERLVRPSTRVLFVGEREAYPLVGGEIWTNSVWLAPKSCDSYAVAYFRKHGAWPDVIFIDRVAVDLRGGYPAIVARHDPLLGRVDAGYLHVGDAGGFMIFVPARVRP